MQKKPNKNKTDENTEEKVTIVTVSKGDVETSPIKGGKICVCIAWLCYKVHLRNMEP